MDNIFILASVMSLGVFCGNWVFMPLANKRLRFKDGFFIGLIAGVVNFGLMVGFHYLIH